MPCARRLAVALSGCVFAASVTLASAPYDFGFGSHGGPIVAGEVPGMDALDPASCRGCHAEVYAEWAGSMHARSFVDPVFRAELAQTADGRPCRSCHAPLAPVAELEGPRHDVGVACAACHVRAGKILSTHAPSTPAPHAIEVVPELDGTRFCGSCHDFRFPDLTRVRNVSYDPDAMQQSTASEWARSPHARAGRDCVSCHMPVLHRPSGREGATHALRSLEDPALVREALTITARATTRPTSTHLELRLTVRGAGHAVPTGDIFRELRIRASNDRGEVEQRLRRSFAEQRSARGWVLMESFDGRVMPDEPRDIALELPKSAGPVRYVVDILRLDLGDARRRGLDESFVIVPVLEGTIVPSSARR